MLFPLWRTILLLSMLSQFTYFSPPQEANICVNCALILTYLLICIHHITLCWQLSMRYACWKLKANCWNLIFLCVASMPLLWIIALRVNSYARLIDACLESTIHEKSLLYGSFVHSCHLPLLWSLHSLHMLTIVWSRLWWHVT